VKSYLSERGIDYEIRDVTMDTGAVRDLVRYGSRSTPTLVIGDEVIIGFDPDRIDELTRE